MTTRRRDYPGRELVELAALADGSLRAERRASLEAQVAASAELREELEEQSRAVGLARSAARHVEAPAALRARIESRRRQVHRGVLIAAAAATALAVAGGLVFVSSGTNGERLHAELAASALAPTASGSATLTRTSSGWRVALQAHRLPRLAEGRFYEAWLRSRAGVLVPLGTFDDGRNVTLWAGVSPRRFTTLTVTEETANRDEASSRKTVLVGRVETGP